MAQPYVLAFVGENANGILRWWTEQIMAALAPRGLGYRLIDLRNEQWKSHLGDVLAEGNPAFCFSFQGFGMDLRLNGENYWGRNAIPFLSYLGDSPYHCPALHAAEGEGLYLLYGCEDFLQIYQHYLGGRLYATTLRYGYPKNDAADTPWTKRQHDAVFAKTAVDPVRLRDEWRAFPPTTRSILEDASSLLLSGADKTVADACAGAFAAAQIYWGDRRELFLFTCSTVDRYIRAVRAERMVQALLPHRATILGDWRHLDSPRTRARFSDPVAADKLDALYATAKVTVSTSPSVRHGMHERVMAGLLAGSAVLSDGTPFLHRTLAACPSFSGLDIDAPDFAGQVGTTLSRMLSDRAMPGLVEQSTAVAAELFSMDSFAEALLGFLALESHRRTLSCWTFPPQTSPVG